MKKRFAIFGRCLLVFSLFYLAGCDPKNGSGSGNGNTEYPFKKCQSIVAGAGERYAVPGIVLYIKTAQKSYNFVYNYSSSMFEKVSASSLFRIGSLSKNYVATLILKLDEMNILSVDQEIGIINVPGIAYPYQITVKLLLCHRSGLGDYINNVLSGYYTYGSIVEFGTLWNYPQKTWTFDELLSLANGPQGLPNVSYNYASTNYLIAGKIIDCVCSGEYYSNRTPQISKYLDEFILVPQSLSNTHYLETETSYPNLAKGYEKIMGTITDVTEFHPSVSNSGGSIIASAADLANYVDKLFNEKIINSSSLNKMLTNYGSGAGLGILLDYKSGLGDIYFHTGSLPGYYSIFKYYPSKKTTIVLLMNTATNPTASSAQADIIRGVEALL